MKTLSITINPCLLSSDRKVISHWEGVRKLHMLKTHKRIMTVKSPLT